MGAVMGNDEIGRSGTPLPDGPDARLPNPAAGKPVRRVGFVLLPHFNAMATFAAIDPLRAANYVSAQKVYDWTLLSLDGGAVKASNGVTVSVDVGLDARPRFDLLFVSASWTPEAHRDSRFFGWLRQLARTGVTLGGIDTGAIVLAYAGLLNGYRATTHYEHLEGFKETFPKVEVSDRIVVFDRDRITCCGGIAATDMALEIIRLEQGIGLANAAARYVFHDRLRSPGESQLHPAHEPVGSVVHRKLVDAILLMEHNIENPLAIPRIASQAGLSIRRMERLFKDNAGVTPARYYLNLRLDRARGLITQTDLQVLEVAVACGFKSTEHFARAYRKRFDISPREDRTAGRIPFQYRSLPSHGSLTDLG